MKEKIIYLKKKANYIRSQILDMCVRAGTGHVTSSFSCTELLVALYYGEILRYDATNPKWNERDRFILSKGQSSVILYPILADLGFFPKKELDKFNQKDGIFGVHLQHDVPGAEITAGSLGHGFGIAAGMALAAKMNKEQYFIFTLLGDGECHEGSVWETAMFASHQRLNNLIAIIDRNWLSATDFTENSVSLNPLDEKWRSFGWDVLNINGHSFEEIFNAINGFRSNKRNKPLMIIADTIKGKGVSFMENQILWHSIAPQGEQAVQAKKEISNRGGQLR
ncbi:transketolase [bacterium]|nr:transketolase [bacterium]